MTESEAAPFAMTLEGIVKEFPGVKALQGVDLALRPGAVHALLGENGAGKSTLIKIATGAQQADAGVIRIGGQHVVRPNRRALQTHGVRAIYQERQIARDLSVAENVMLDRLPRSALGSVDWRAARKMASERLHTLGIDLDPGASVDRLSVAQLQLVEIARAVSYDARVMVMDEPTASLSRHEVEPLFDVIRRLRDAGVAVLFISHHLDEVFEVADDVTVLRDGQRVATGALNDLSRGEIVSMMFGRSVAADQVELQTPDVGEEMLVADQLSGRRVDGVTLSARRGEVVAVTGGIGAGVSELARMLSGAQRPTGGRLAVRRPNGFVTLRSRRHAVKCGVAFVPADRKRQGLLLDMAITHNAMMGKQARDRHPLFTPRTIRSEGSQITIDAKVKAPNALVRVSTLSGGNQQKVLIGRWLAVDSEVLIFDEPTAGIDIASKFEIYETLRRLAREGAAVVVCSTDFQEVTNVADRVIVLRAGRMVGELSGDEIDEHRLIELEIGDE